MHINLMRAEYTRPTSEVINLGLEHNVLSGGGGTETGGITPGTWDDEDEG